MLRTAPRMAGYVSQTTVYIFSTGGLPIDRRIRFVFRENRVPYYQRLFQSHDGKRQWYQTSRSNWVMYPYLISVYGLGAATMYAMGRMVFGHKTWFGKN
ncbi:hypothetical protein BJY04DRAFT_212900 [Aspergillus karnatakaensis]|uniref:cytochrome c oxidase subunit 7 n=1 Tax=Aspergillus karnatakaensis TaxID=1810916 RepID=UPI003CCDACA2